MMRKATYDGKLRRDGRVGEIKTALRKAGISPVKDGHSFQFKYERFEVWLIDQGTEISAKIFTVPSNEEDKQLLLRKKMEDISTKEKIRLCFKFSIKGSATKAATKVLERLKNLEEARARILRKKGSEIPQPPLEAGP